MKEQIGKETLCFRLVFCVDSGIRVFSFTSQVHNRKCSKW